MENDEVLEFLRELEAYLKRENYSARKIDIVEEAQKRAGDTEDSDVVKTQLTNVGILMEQIGGSRKERDDPSEKEEEAFCSQIQKLLQSSHKNGMELAADFCNSSDTALCEVDRELGELRACKAAYGDLMDSARLKQRIGRIKERYEARIASRQKDFVSDIMEEYGHTMKKVKMVFTGPKAGKFKLSAKKAYEVFDSGQDLFENQAEAVGLRTDAAGNVLEDFAKRLGERTERIRKRANQILAMAVVVTAVIWGGFFLYLNGTVNQAVAEYSNVAGAVNGFSESLGEAGGVIKMALENKAVAEVVNGTVEKPLTEIASAVMGYLKKLYVIVVVCFYIIMIPAFLAVKKRRCIIKLESAVDEELKIFKETNGLKQRLEDAADDTIRKIEGMYAEKCKALCPPPERTEWNEAVKETEAASLADRWSRLKVKYGI